MTGHCCRQTEVAKSTETSETDIVKAPKAIARNSIYGFLNEALGISDNTASNNRLERCGSHGLISFIVPAFWQEELTINETNPSTCSLSPCRDSNPLPPEYESKLLTTLPPLSYPYFFLSYFTKVRLCDLRVVCVSVHLYYLLNA